MVIAFVMTMTGRRVSVYSSIKFSVISDSINPPEMNIGYLALDYLTIKGVQLFTFYVTKFKMTNCFLKY